MLEKRTPVGISIVFVASCLVGTRPGSAGEPSGTTDLKNGKIDILVVTGGHGYDEPAFDAMYRAMPAVRHHHEKHPVALKTITSDRGGEFDVIVLYDMYQQISEAERLAYAERIRGGTGLVVLHHALANFQDWPEYQRIIGGRYFLRKQTRDGVEVPASTYRHDLTLRVEIADRDHYVTRGLEDFVIEDEAYNFFAVDPAARVLLRTKHPHSGPVIGWTKPYGKGRIAAFQLGHDAKAYNNPSYRELVSRAIQWTARRTPEDQAREPLFNGTDLSGWKTAGAARFAVEDGIIVGRQGPNGEAGDLFTTKEYGDFELEITWAMDWPGNSGVWFRYAGGNNAYQADILEWKDPVCWSGSLYRSGKMFVAMNEEPSIVRREGWNTFLIRADEDHVMVHLNGRTVADVEDDGPRRGRIGLQVHAGEKFRRMAIRIADARIRALGEH